MSFWDALTKKPLDCSVIFSSVKCLLAISVLPSSETKRLAQMLELLAIVISWIAAFSKVRGLPFRR